VRKKSKKERKRSELSRKEEVKIYMDLTHLKNKQLETSLWSSWNVNTMIHSRIRINNTIMQEIIKV